jgi:hypothetical protein
MLVKYLPFIAVLVAVLLAVLRQYKHVVLFVPKVGWLLHTALGGSMVGPGLPPQR